MMMSPTCKTHGPGLLLPALFFCLALSPLRSPAATPPAVSPGPPDLATNLSADTDLAWGLADVNILANGGFETGDTSGWGREEIGSGAIFMEQGTTAEGNYCALIYAVNFPSGQYGLYQDVALPQTAGQIVLRWSHLLQNEAPDFSNEPIGRQGYRVELRNLDNSLRQVLYTTMPGDPLMQNWTKLSADLSAFRGETVRIAFIGYGNIDFMILLLDRMSVTSEAPSGVISDVLLDTNSIVGGDDLVGSTAATTWDLPELEPATTYYWRIVTRSEGTQYTGPTWRFTTAPRGPLDHFSWITIPSPQPPGPSLPVTLTARDGYRFAVTNFTGPAFLSALALQWDSAPQTLLPDEPFTAYTSFKNATVGYAFTPTTNLWVRALRLYSGDQVSLWTETGLLLARETVPTVNQSWTDLPLAQPVPLQANHQYRIGVYSKSAVPQCARFDGLDHFAHGTLDQAYSGSGNSFPTEMHPARWWFVDLIFQTAQMTPLPIAPTLADNFVNGVWSGIVSFPPQEATNVVLLAEAATGAIGYANLFDLLASNDTDGDGMPDDWETLYGFNPDDPADAAEDADDDGQTNLQEYQAGTHPLQASSVFRIATIRVDQEDVILVFPTVSGKRYHLERAPDLEADAWSPIATNLVGTGTAQQLVDPGAAQAGTAFYRLLALPGP